MNAVDWHERSARLFMTGWERWYTGNCARDLRFGYVDKRYRHKPESVQEKEADKILWDFEIQTDHWIQIKPGIN